MSHSYPYTVYVTSLSQAPSLAHILLFPTMKCSTKLCSWPSSNTLDDFPQLSSFPSWYQTPKWVMILSTPSSARTQAPISGCPIVNSTFIFSRKLIPSPLISNSAYGITFYLFLQTLKKSSLSCGLVISTSEIFLELLLLTFPSRKPLRLLLPLILITTTIW